MANLNINEFVKKMQKRIGKPPVRLEKRVTVGDYDEEVILQSLTEEELDRAVDYSKEPNAQDEFAVYLASPTLRELAEKLVELGSIAVPTDVMKQFKRGDINMMGKIVGDLTTEYNTPTVTEVNAVKNK